MQLSKKPLSPFQGSVKTGTYQGLTPLASLLPPSRGLHDATRSVGGVFTSMNEQTGLPTKANPDIFHQTLSLLLLLS